MAGRGGPKLKEYRTHVTSVRHWLKECEYEGIIMCEVYCGLFGNCQVILPTINSLMLSVDDAEDKIKWLVINVARLEEEQRLLLQEEEKKKTEMENVQRRKALSDKADEGGANAASGAEDANGTASTASLVPAGGSHGGDDEETKLRTSWDKITIPKLEKYSGYDHPRPLWLLIKDGVVLYELNAANPPKMQRILQAALSGVTLSEKELAEMDFKRDEVAVAKRRKNKPTKKELEERARKEARALKRERKRNKPEVQRVPEYLVQVKLTDIHRPAAAAAAAAGISSAALEARAPLLVLYTKDAAADDFTYYGQTERQVGGELNPVYIKSFGFPAAEVAAALEQGTDIECKFVLYDHDGDLGAPPGKDAAHASLLGEAYVSLRTLLGNEGEGGLMEVKLKKHTPPAAPAALETKRSGRDKKAAAAAALLEEEKQDDDAVGTLTLSTKLRVSEGAVTNYRLYAFGRNLPALSRDGWGVASVQPSLVGPDGEPLDAALVDAESRREYVLEVTQSDANSLRAPTLGMTEVVAGSSDPAFATPLMTQHATRDDRTITFTLYDAQGLGEGVPSIDSTTHALPLRKHVIGTARIGFEALLLQRRQFANSVTLPLVDANGDALVGADMVATASLMVRLDELAEDGSVEEFDEEDDEALEVAAAKAKAAEKPNRLEVALSVLGLPPALHAPIHTQDTHKTLVALFVKNPATGLFEFLSATERESGRVPAPGEADAVAKPISYRKTFVLDAPKPPSADTFVPLSSSRESARGSASATPRMPGSARTQMHLGGPSLYKFVLIDAASDEVARSASAIAAVDPAHILGETSLELTEDFIAHAGDVDQLYTLPVLERAATRAAGHQMSLQLRIAPVGKTQQLDLAFSARGLQAQGPAEFVAPADPNEPVDPSTLPTPLIKVYLSHATLGQSLVLAGSTERSASPTSDPTFLTKVSVEQYELFERTATVVAYDCGGVSGEEHIIGECSFTLSEFLERSAASAAMMADAQAGGQAQPVEFKLQRVVEQQDGLRTREDVEGAVVFVTDVTPRAGVAGAATKSTVASPRNGEAEQQDVPAPEDLEAIQAQQADQIAAALNAAAAAPAATVPEPIAPATESAAASPSLSKRASATASRSASRPGSSVGGVAAAAAASSKPGSKPSSRPGSSVATGAATPKSPKSVPGSPKKTASRPGSGIKVQPAAPAAAAAAPAEEHHAAASAGEEPHPDTLSPQPARSRPVSASQKLARNLSRRNSLEEAEAVAKAMAMQAAATPAQAVAESALTAQEHTQREQMHDEASGAGAVGALPAPGEHHSATAVESPVE